MQLGPLYVRVINVKFNTYKIVVLILSNINDDSISRSGGITRLAAGSFLNVASLFRISFPLNPYPLSWSTEGMSCKQSRK